MTGPTWEQRFVGAAADLVAAKQDLGQVGREYNALAAQATGQKALLAEGRAVVLALLSVLPCQPNGTPEVNAADRAREWLADVGGG